MPKDLTIIIPAFNEEKNVGDAIQNTVDAVKDMVDDYEIIVVDDGSRDNTGKVAESKAKLNPKVRVVYNEKNMGYGYSLARGFQLATKEYLATFPGDNDASSLSLQDIIRQMGQADVIVSYMENMKKRNLLRRFITRSFVLLLNSLFGLNLKYYSGLFLFKRSAIQSLKIQSDGLAVIAECIVRLIKAGCSYKEISFVHVGRTAGKSSALRVSSIKSGFKTLWILVREIYFNPRQKEEASCMTS